MCTRQDDTDDAKPNALMLAHGKENDLALDLLLGDHVQKYFDFLY